MLHSNFAVDSLSFSHRWYFSGLQKDHSQFNFLSCSPAPLGRFNFTFSEQAHFSAYGRASSRPPRAAKTCPLDTVSTSKHTHPHLFSSYSLSPQPSSASSLCSISFLSSTVSPPRLLYLPNFLSLPSAVCSGISVLVREMCAQGARGVLRLCHRFPLAPGNVPWLTVPVA